jgi:hypothetical protein
VSEPGDQEAKEALSDIVSHLLEECRMVLPGIQALFGFQLVAVFNQAFWERLNGHEQYLHLAAVTLIVIAIALVMTPAAYHRQAEPDRVSRRFVAVCSRLLLWSMVPLLIAICLDFYLVARLIVHNMLLSLGLALLMSVLFIVPWFVLPRFKRLKDWISQ